MILMMGPPGAGKSLQGQILAARFNLEWLSVGKLLRSYQDPALSQVMETGDLLPADVTNQIVLKYLDQRGSLDGLIIDGYPRLLEQAKALNDYAVQSMGHSAIEMLIVLDIGREEIVNRLLARGRPDDNEQVITHRIQIYAEQEQPLIDFYENLGVRIEHLIGSRTVGQVHDDIANIWYNLYKHEV